MFQTKKRLFNPKNPAKTKVLPVTVNSINIIHYPKFQLQKPLTTPTTPTKSPYPNRNHKKKRSPISKLINSQKYTSTNCYRKSTNPKRKLSPMLPRGPTFSARESSRRRKPRSRLSAFQSGSGNFSKWEP